MTRCIPQIILALAILTPYTSLHSQSKKAFNGYDLVDKTGNIRKPTDVRDLYQFLGTYTPTGSNGDTEMHVTYASPGAAQYYRKNGKFADGTVLVKETFTTDHAQMTTGDARWATNKTIVW
ncbi:MAG: cytochrome P460 family protein, partial [Candidatus Acidiferrales bacterium]